MVTKISWYWKVCIFWWFVIAYRKILSIIISSRPKAFSKLRKIPWKIRIFFMEIFVGIFWNCQNTIECHLWTVASALCFATKRETDILIWVRSYFFAMHYHALVKEIQKHVLYFETTYCGCIYRWIRTQINLMGWHQC